MMGSGVRVPIRLTSVTKLRGGIKGVDSFSLFPGAIVALRGRNVGGEYFLADEILAVSCLPSSVLQLSSLHSFPPSERRRHPSVTQMVAFLCVLPADHSQLKRICTSNLGRTYYKT